MWVPIDSMDFLSDLIHPNLSPWEERNILSADFSPVLPHLQLTDDTLQSSRLPLHHSHFRLGNKQSRLGEDLRK